MPLTSANRLRQAPEDGVLSFPKTTSAGNEGGLIDG